jgi:FeS assembly SUF system regulator
LSPPSFPSAQVWRLHGDATSRGKKKSMSFGMASSRFSNLASIANLAAYSYSGNPCNLYSFALTFLPIAPKYNLSATDLVVYSAQMLKLTKKADYGLIAMRHLAQQADLGACSAKDLADMYGMPQEALAKILQKLTKAGLLVSQYGVNGGYALARDPRRITAFEVIRAIDGPLFMTSCSTAVEGCDQGSRCTVREPLRKVSRSIEQVLDRLTIWEMTEPEHGAAPKVASMAWTPRF